MVVIRNCTQVNTVSSDYPGSREVGAVVVALNGWQGHVNSRSMRGERLFQEDDKALIFLAMLPQTVLSNHVRWVPN
jgi:hypothetical protein